MPSYDFYESPRGRMLLVADDQALIGVYFVGQKYQPRIEGDWIRNTRHALLRQVKRELAEYFGGRRSPAWASARPSPMENSRVALAVLAARAQWALPPDETRLASSYPATASSVRMARSPATPAAWRKSMRSWPWKSVHQGFAIQHDHTKGSMRLLASAPPIHGVLNSRTR